ncbi:MAG TPA: four helix bundle protein [Planctomycetota bacterium]|nr:four helix bundle protein [Planctomycetota bacterium]
MRFHALERSIRIIEQLRPIVRYLRVRDRKLASHITDAASSIALNLGEGARRCGGDRRHLYRVASGSAEEVRTGLRVATAWGHLSLQTTAQVNAEIDELQAMLWTLVR